MKLAVLSETSPGERRVSASPDTVKAYVKKGLAVVVQAGAGAGAHISDEAFVAAGASIIKSDAGLKDADVVLAVRRPSDAILKSLKKVAVVAAGLDPYGERKGLEALAKSGQSFFAMELMPRISRAQSMDILSSQSNLAGYKAVIDAAAFFGRAFPMMMTAAGTVPPAKVFIMGVGVAGLQAIATARRLGAIVSATDVRKAAEEQVKSLGAKFVFADVADAATAGGYSGCNQYGGRYVAGEDGALQFRELANTLMACDKPEGVQDQETAFLAALNTIDAYTLDAEGRLTLLADGAEAMTFTAVEELPMNPEDLVGTAWKLTEMDGEPPVAGGGLRYRRNRTRRRGRPRRDRLHGGTCACLYAPAAASRSARE